MKLLNRAATQPVRRFSLRDETCVVWTDKKSCDHPVAVLPLPHSQEASHGTAVLAALQIEFQSALAVFTGEIATVGDYDAYHLGLALLRSGDAVRDTIGSLGGLPFFVAHYWPLIRTAPKNLVWQT
jgi:hypothetical protein